MSSESTGRTQRVVVCIDEHHVPLDRSDLLSLMCIVSEAHGKVCQEIGTCGDMHVADELAQLLPGYTDAHARLEQALSQLDAAETL